MSEYPKYFAGAMLPIEREVARGFRFAHLMLLAAQHQDRETVQIIETLRKQLIAKGVFNEAEWQAALANAKAGARD